MATKKAVWISKFIYELGVVPSIVDPILLYCDDNGVIAKENGITTSTKF